MNEINKDGAYYAYMCGWLDCEVKQLKKDIMIDVIHMDELKERAKKAVAKLYGETQKSIS